jgi:drug/metabolite transporter (DMT)-like permease
VTQAAPQSPRARLGADAALLLITAVWGGTFVTVKDALTSADTFTFLTLRFLLGAATAALIARGDLKDPRVWRRGGALGVLVFGGYAFQTVGLESTSPSRSAFITGLTVIFVPFATGLVARLPPRQPIERLGPWSIAAVVIAGVGLWQLTGVDLSQPFSRGDLLTLGCALVYSVHVAATSRLAKDVAPMALVTVQLLVTCVLSAAMLPFVERRFEPTSALLGAVVLTGVVASAFAIGVQAWAQARTSPVRAAVIYALEPVFAVAYVVALGRGWPSRNELVGGALVIAALLVSELGPALPWRRATTA